MVDDSYPPAYRLLPPWGLRAEYWIEGAGSEYGRDTNETGTFLYLATDQVRFYPIDAAQLHAHAGGGGYGRWNQTADEPLPLETIPPLVFSEILRDVDLFVGVASVGNDPGWADGGPAGQYRDYWQSYSFGELSATARDAPGPAGAPDTATEDRRPLLPCRSLSDRSRNHSHLQDPSGQRQYPDGAEQPVPVHRAETDDRRRRARPPAV